MEVGQSVRFVYHKNWKLWNSDKYNAGGALCILNGLQSGFMEKSRRSKETFSERSAAVKEQCLKMLFCNCCQVSKALLGCSALKHRLKPKNTIKGKSVFWNLSSKKQCIYKWLISAVKKQPFPIWLLLSLYRINSQSSLYLRGANLLVNLTVKYPFVLDESSSPDNFGELGSIWSCLR